VNSSLPFWLLWGVAAGFCWGPLIAWAIRSWPGHETLVPEYLGCPHCASGLRRGCCNSGQTQDRLYAIASGLIAAFSVWYFGMGMKALLSWVFSVSCLIITVVDIRFLIIPDSLSINGCYAGLLYAVACHLLWRLSLPLPDFYVPLQESFLGFLLGGGFLWGLGWLAWLILKKEGMGGGDVKLLAAMGAWLGWKPVLGTIVLASLFGSAGGVLGILYQRVRYGKKYQPLSHMIPFGPYLCLGFLLIFFLGMEPLYGIFDAYQRWLEGRLYH
jgi:leader peptidase (prepilin peptidase)/N-methyltransferase